MQAVKRYILDCPRILWMAYFRPYDSIGEVEKLNRQQRVWLIVLSLFAMAASILFLTQLIGLLLEALGIHFDFALSLKMVAVGVAGRVLFSVLFSVLLGILLGVSSDNLSYVLVGVGLGFKLGIASGTAFGVAGGLVFGVIGSITIGVLLDVVLGILIGVAVGIFFETVFGGGANIAVGVTSGVFFGVCYGVIVCVLFSVLFGVAFSIAVGVAVGIAFGVTIGAADLDTYYCLLFPIEVMTAFLIFRRAGLPPRKTTEFFQKTIDRWDEATLMPQRVLSRLLVVLGERDKEAVRETLVNLKTNTFYKRAAVSGILELESREMLYCRTVEEIAQCGSAFYWVPSIEPSNRLWQATEAFAQCQKVSSEIGAAISATSNYSKLTAFHRARRQLEELSKFAVLKLRGRESRIFVQIAEQWLRIVDAEVDRLMEEERVTENVPNPYLAPNPLGSSSEMFFGRHEAFRFVEEHFLREGESAPIVLYGQPRIGKTSLLRNLDQRLTTDLISVYVDMQRSAQVESTGGLLFNLAKTIGQQLVSRGMHVKQLSLDAFAHEPFIVFDNFLDEVERAIRAPENRLILALDEFEQIEKQLTAGKVSADLMDFLRGMMQSRSGIRMIFAGTHTLDEMVSGLWTQYFRSALSCHIGYLDEHSARSLITNPIKEFPLNYEPEAVDLLIEQTHCHPCLIQLTCSVLVDLKNAQKSRHASVADVKQAFEKVLKEAGKNVFPGIWGWIPPGEQKLLAVLASSEPMTIAQLALPLPGTEVNGMVERLVENELLTRDEEGCRFQVVLFRQWVVRHAARMGMDFSVLKETARQR